MLISKSKKSYNRKSKSKLQSGTYTSTVINIDFHPDYEAEEAILVEYLLEDDKGNEHPFKETFYNVVNNDRTQSFYSYLVKNGIQLENFKSFIGCSEQLVLKKVIKNNVPMLSISDRKFVAKAGGANGLQNKKPSLNG